MIQELHQQGVYRGDIAERLGVHRKTVSRALKRGGPPSSKRRRERYAKLKPYLGTVAKRISDPDVLRVLKLILKATGKRGIAQGDVIAPLLSNVYLTEVDRMLERGKAVTRYGEYTYVKYVRFADDIVS